MSLKRYQSTYWLAAFASFPLNLPPMPPAFFLDCAPADVEALALAPHADIAPKGKFIF